MDTVVPDTYGKVTPKSLCIYVSRHLSLCCSGRAEWCEMGYTYPSLANYYREAVAEKSKSLTVVCVVNILIWVPSPKAHGALFREWRWVHRWRHKFPVLPHLAVTNGSGTLLAQLYSGSC